MPLVRDWRSTKGVGMTLCIRINDRYHTESLGSSRYIQVFIFADYGIVFFSPLGRLVMEIEKFGLHILVKTCLPSSDKNSHP